VHILLLNEYFPPDSSATANQAAIVADALAEKHRVTVLCGRPSYDPSERHPYYLHRRKVCGNLTIERVGSTAFPRFQMRRRICNYLTYVSLAVPRALTISADVIISMTDPPFAGIVGAFVARLRRRQFVYNIRDLYPDMAVGGDIVKPSFWVRHWERMHRRALRRAARVIVLGEDMRDRIISKGVDPARIVIVRDGVSVPEQLPHTDHPVIREFRSGFRFVLVHAGNLGFYGAWQTLVQAARLLENDGVGLIFIGEGAQRAQIEVMAAGASNIRFLPFRPAGELPYVLAAADVHVITVRRGLEGVVVPSKLYPILAAGKPVLAVTPEECDVARIVRRENCGAVADPDDSAAVVAAVRCLAGDSVALEAMGRRAREISYSYDRVKQLQIFLRAVEEAADSGSAVASK
jgi:colanic acid biosynthesis glycosyl transferase WcaI